MNGMSLPGCRARLSCAHSGSRIPRSPSLLHLYTPMRLWRYVVYSTRIAFVYAHTHGSCSVPLSHPYSPIDSISFISYTGSLTWQRPYPCCSSSIRTLYFIHDNSMLSSLHGDPMLSIVTVCSYADSLSGAAGNFLAPISGLSENAFRTVMEIDSVCFAKKGF